METTGVSALKMKDTNKMTDTESDLKKDNKPEAGDNLKSDAKPATVVAETDKENLNNVEENEKDDEKNSDENLGDKSLEIDENAKTAKDPVRRKKIAGFILDKSLRIRSYARRRPIPLKRIIEIDIQCGTKSFMIQINNDFEEAVYCGNNDLVKCFLSPQGLKISDVNSVLVSGKYQPRPRGTAHHWEHDYNPAPDTDDEDEEFFDTVKNKKDRDKEMKAAESGKKSGELEYIKNPAERFKKFKSFKDGIFAKVKEIDSICGVSTFVVIVSLERDCAYYHGPENLVSEFFTTGISRGSLLSVYNVRKFELDEVDNNVCCVPQCAVTRNTLSKWRLAAVEFFRFPPEIPFSLHICPEEDRDKWIAEIDLDPAHKVSFINNF